MTTVLQDRNKLRTDAYAHGKKKAKQRIWQLAKNNGDERAYIIDNYEEKCIILRERRDLADKHKFFIESAINEGMLKAWDDALEWALDK